MILAELFDSWWHWVLVLGGIVFFVWLWRSNDKAFKETRIGPLVGLAFIILFAIILSMILCEQWTRPLMNQIG